MSFSITDDPLADFNRYDRAQTEWLMKRPVCCYCWERIQDEKLFNINGHLYHEDCASEEFRKDTEDYIEGDADW